MLYFERVLVVCEVACEACSGGLVESPMRPRCGPDLEFYIHPVVMESYSEPWKY